MVLFPLVITMIVCGSLAWALSKDRTIIRVTSTIVIVCLTIVALYLGDTLVNKLDWPRTALIVLATVCIYIIPRQYIRTIGMLGFVVLASIVWCSAEYIAEVLIQTRKL